MENKQIIKWEKHPSMLGFKVTKPIIQKRMLFICIVVVLGLLKERGFNFFYFFNGHIINVSNFTR